MEVSELERLREFVDFLDGTGSIDGLSFGDARPTTPFIAGRFWWRKTHLPAMKNAVEALSTQAAELDALRVENDENCRLLGISAERELALRSELDALRGEVGRLDTTPWKDFYGDLPDYDHPLRCVYESGIQYAVNLLAATLKVDDWEVCDGTEEFDGDLGGTLFNIVLAALPTDQHGDPMHPSEITATIAQLRDRVAGLEEFVLKWGRRADSLPHPYCVQLEMDARALLSQNEVG